MLGRRWDLTDGVLPSGLEITDDDRRTWRDRSNRLSEPEVLHGLT